MTSTALQNGCIREKKVFALISAGNVGEQPQKHEKLQQALRETPLSPSKTRQWYSNFINGRTSIDFDHT